MRRFLEISKRVQNAQFSPMRKFLPFLEKVKQKGIEVFQLQIGQPDFEMPREVLREIRNFQGKVLPYTNSTGIEELKEAWQKYYQSVGIKVNVSDIIITAGASEAILISFLIVCDPGEELVVFEPFFPAYNTFATLTNLKLKPIRTFPSNGFHLPKKEEILKKIGKKTKGILICNPNNPTGTVYTKKELKTIVQIAKEKNLFVLSDETYREFVFEGKHYSILNFSEIKDRAILIDSASKRFNVCGARIGCLVSKNKKIIEGATKIAQARLSLPKVEQMAIVPLLKNPTKYVEKIFKEYKKRREVVMQALKKIPEISWVKPEGTYYALLKLPIKNSDHFAKWLLTEFSLKGKTVLVTPAAEFYATPGLGQDEIRIAFVLPPKKLKEAIKILGEGLREYRKHF